MIKVIPFMPGHLDFMELKAVHAGEAVVDNFNSLWNQPGVHSKTLVCDGSPISSIALLHVREGVAECIMACSETTKDFSVAFAREIKKLHDEYVEKLKLHRIQITIRAGNAELIRWAEFLGFKQEGLMRKYGSQGQDYFMYARVYGC